MHNESVKRKLSAILSADVQGYSLLMGDDERATVETITAYRKIMTELIQGHHGRVIDAKGDNVLAEFASVVDAIRCSVEVQKELKARNVELPENRRMDFRIGINLGDVIEDGDFIYGDGVNIAARLEGLAEGGGISISGTAFDQVENKLGLDFEYLGKQALKNIQKPVRVYRIEMERAVSTVGINEELPLPEKPSLAVLPFVNMSGDPEQEYFCDGMSEDIITALSQSANMFVIARNSTFVYKGKSVNVQRIGRELGVQYVLEGSIRKAGHRVRINAQLIDATTGHHLWSERYDRVLEDIFNTQDEITWKILTALAVKLTDGEQARVYARGTENLEAYSKVGQAYTYYNRGDKGSNLLARQICEEIISMEPKWELPYCLLGWTHWQDVMFGYTDSPEESVRKAFQLAQKAMSLNEESSLVHGLLSYLYIMTRQHEKALEASERSISLDPNSADAHAFYGFNLLCSDDYSKAVSILEKALRLNPFPPGWYFSHLGTCYAALGKYEEAIAACKNAVYREPSSVSSHLALAGAYAAAGRKQKASAQGEEVLKLDPDFSLERLTRALPYKNRTAIERAVSRLRKAGLK